MTPGRTDDDPEDPRGHLTVVKTATSTAPAGGYRLGDTVTYRITVTNDGNLTITNINVTDERTGFRANVPTLAPTESASFTTTTTVTEADIIAGVIINDATATGTSPDPENPTVPVTPGHREDDPEDPNGHLTVTKATTSRPANGTAYIIGETITYEITVTNDGNLTITGIVLTDERTGLRETIASLAPGATSTVFQTSTTVTAADVTAGVAVNDATVTGTSPDPRTPVVPVTPGHTEDRTMETVDLTVQKVWVNTTTPANPENLIMTLTGNGTSQYVTLNAANNWTGTIRNLPRYNAAGAEITYTWSEPTIPGYEQTSAVTTGNTTVITNTQTQVEAEAEYTLTVRYRFLNGREAAPDVTEQHVEGDTYTVVSPTLRGYTTTTLRVTGVMPASNVTRTVIYIPGTNTVVIDDFETPLGLGNVFINVGDCLE